MPTPDPQPSGESLPAVATDSWPPDTGPGGRADKGQDSPTVRSGSGSGSAGSSPTGSWRGAGAAALPLPEPGQRLESFELEEPIGVGGMGAVFLARDTRLDRPVALKILPPEQSHDVEVVHRFYQEGRAAARLDHENIARVFTIGHDRSYHFIAFEYIEGTTIRQRVEQHGPLPVAEAINYTLQIAAALVHAAERGVVHRDIKPSNIIITPQGRAKLVDMGLARRFERGGEESLTQSGMTLGTFDYISPEQARDPRDVDVRSDLYSLGCTLFHMLTGRPPFPEGTVLQKLLHHQEDPPPDILTLNPTIPPDLAVILQKLMAKDRDRRYQTPEQLVRDLLTLAGALGLRSISPEGLVWMTATGPPVWERHLFWSLPALALALTVSWLVWKSQQVVPEPPWPPDVSQAAAPALSASRVATPIDSPAEPNAPETHTPAAASSGRTGAADSGSSGGQPRPPRSIEVKPGDDLLTLLAEAPPRSTLVLSGSGPYTLRAGSEGREAPARLVLRDLTLKAAPGVRPVLRPASGASGPLLQFVGGRLTLEGLEFQPGPGRVAVVVEDTELNLRHCLFRRRRGPRAEGGSHPVALEIHASSAARTAGELAVPVHLRDCHFDGGQTGIMLQGPAEVGLRDCTFAAADPAFLLTAAPDSDSTTAAASASALVGARLWLNHVSVLAGPGPVFQVDGIAAHIQVDRSVVAPPKGAAEAVLVAGDDPDRLDWVGRENLYARVGTFYRPDRDRAGQKTLWDFDAWADDPRVREDGAIVTGEHVWEEADPAAALADEGLARAFRLGPAEPAASQIGARSGPTGATAPATGRTARVSSPSRTGPPNPTGSTSPGGPNPLPGAVASESRKSGPEAPSPAPAPGNPVEPTTVPPMTIVPRDSDSEPPPEPRPKVGPDSLWSVPELDWLRGGGTSGKTRPGESPADLDKAPIRTTEQFQAALERLGDRGGTLLLAADADLVLGPCPFSGTGRWSIKAQPDPARRPRIRFQSPTHDSPVTGPVLFRLRSGTLEVRGVDFVLSDAEVPPEGRRSAFGVSAGTSLELDRCTVSVEGADSRSSVVAVLSAEAIESPGAGLDESATASVLVRDSLLRSGGDVLDVAPAHYLDLKVTNSVVFASGSLVHGHGLPRGRSAPPLEINLQRVTARLAGGLVLLESTAEAPGLPSVNVVARESIFSSPPKGEPLIRVDGQEALESLHDRVRWEGHEIAYHNFEVYRRDQTAQPGTPPDSYRLSSWQVAVGDRDENPHYGTIQFAHESELDRRPSWTLVPSDVRLSPDSPVPSVGPDLQRIPEPPPNGSE